MDAEGKILPAGQAGELCVRGEKRSLSYAAEKILAFRGPV